MLYIKYITAAAICCLPWCIKAQQNTYSPYSSLGYGEFIQNPYAPMSSFGSSAAAFASPSFVNPLNPASYAQLGLTHYQAGLDWKYALIQRGDQSTAGLNSEFSHLSMAFPVASGVGLSFGLRPVSRMGYETEKQTTVPGFTTATERFRGEGGFRKVYLGTGFRLGPNLTLGIQPAFVFGTLHRTRSLEFPDSSQAFNSREQNYTSARDLSWETGAQYKTKLGARQLCLGYRNSITGELQVQEESYLERYYRNGRNQAVIDTIIRAIPSKSSMPFPALHEVAWHLQGDKMQWTGSTVVRLFNTEETALNYLPSQHGLYGTIGWGNVPETQTIASFGELMGWSGGMHAGRTHWSTDQGPVYEYGISGGLMVPLIYGGSRVFLTADYTVRTDFAESSIREDILTFSLGIGLNDKWFVKRKYE